MLTTQGDSSHFKTLLASRFAFRVPQDWQIGLGVEVRIRDVTLNEVALAANLSPADGLEAKWAELLAKRRNQVAEAIEMGGTEEMRSLLDGRKVALLSGKQATSFTSRSSNPEANPL